MRFMIPKLVGMVLLLAISNVFAQTYVTDKVVVGVYDIASSEGSLLKALPTGTPLEVLQKSDGFTQVRTPDGLTGWIEDAYIIEHKPAQLVVLELTDKQKQTQAELEDTRKQLLDMQEQVAAAKTNSVTGAELDKLKNTNRRLRNQIGEMDQEMKKLQGNLQLGSEQRKDLEQQVSALQEAIKNAAVPAEQEASTPAADNSNVQQLQTENAAMRKQLDAVYEALSLSTPASTTVNEEGGVSMNIGWLIAWLLILLAGGVVIGWKFTDWMHVKRHGGFRL